MDHHIVLVLMCAAACAGFVDSVAGGGGLITVPALLLAGLTPVEVIATNKLQGTVGVATAALRFWRAGHIDERSLRPAIVFTAAGAILGALAIGAMDQAALTAAMPWVLIAVAIYFALSPRLGQQEKAPRLAPLAFAAGVAAPIGFYDGVFGPGAGSLYVLGFVAVAGLGLLQATANTKVLNLTSNVVALAVFMGGGHVNYAIGLPMALAQAAGAWMGAHVAMAQGARLIRPLLVVVSIGVAIRLLLDSANPTSEWLRAHGLL